ncbi:MAG: sulfotransferase [Pseudomonadota bacterium]|nr:sulfotransferase [Pseudomonadota bacterium]
MSQGRNEKCNCGSNRKYKNCCGANLNKSFSKNEQMIHGLTNLALKSINDGKLTEAIKIYKNLAELEPQEASHAYNIALILDKTISINSKNIIDAVEFARKCVWLSPKKLQYQQLLFSLLVKNYNLKEVLERAKSLPEEIKKDKNIILACAESSNKLGKQKEALRFLKNATGKFSDDPKFKIAISKTYILLSEYENVSKILTNMINNESISAKDEIEARYLLGEALDKMGKNSEALENIRIAGEKQIQMPACKNWLPDEPINILKGLKSYLLEKKSCERPSGLNLSEELEDVVFFVGFPRSGTTLTEQVLASHPKVNTSEEKPILGKSINTIYRNHNTTYEKSSLDILKSVSLDEINEIRQSYLTQIIKDGHVKGSVYIDKLPLNINHLGWIEKVFPDSKIIIAIRDPRDVCLSCFFQNFKPNIAMNYFLSWENTIKYYCAVMDNWLAAKKSINLQWHEVYYEKLTSDFNDELKKILLFLNLEWDTKLERYREDLIERAVATPSNNAIRSPVNKNAVNRWMKYDYLLNMEGKKFRSLIESFGYK